MLKFTLLSLTLLLMLSVDDAAFILLLFRLLLTETS